MVNDSQTFIPYSQQATPPLYFWKFWCKGSNFFMKHGVVYACLSGVCWHSRYNTSIDICVLFVAEVYQLLYCFIASSNDVNESQCSSLEKNSRAREFNFLTSEKFTYAQGEIVLSKLTAIRLS